MPRARDTHTSNYPGEGMQSWHSYWKGLTLRFVSVDGEGNRDPKQGDLKAPQKGVTYLRASSLLWVTPQKEATSRAMSGNENEEYIFSIKYRLSLLNLNKGFDSRGHRRETFTTRMFETSF